MKYLSFISFLTLCIFIIFQSHAWFSKRQQTLIMLAPAGDAHTTGRVVDGTFERAITYAWAQELAHELQQQLPDCQIILSRRPGQTLSPFHAASYANTAGVDLFISLSCYQITGLKPRCDLYLFSYGDHFHNHSLDLTLSPAHEAYLFNRKQTTTIAHTILHELQKEHALTVHGPHAFPFKPLLGLVPPAVGIEVGIEKNDDWKYIIQPMARALKTVIISSARST